MAKTLEERIASALAHASRLADCEAVLVEVRAEHERVTAAKADADVRRADPTLPANQAAEAQLDYEEADLKLRRLTRADEMLVETIATKKAKVAADDHANRYGQVKSRRDKLAAELKERGPVLFAELVGLIQRVQDSDTEIAEMNRARPSGSEWLESAEALARGFAGHTWSVPGGGVVARLVNLQIPHFDRPGSAWPDLEGAERRRGEMMENAARLAREQKEAREASKGWFVVTRPNNGQGQMTLHHLEGALRIGAGAFELEMYPEHVEMARKGGCTVEPRTDANRVWKEYTLEPGAGQREIVSTRDGTITVSDPRTAWLNNRQVSDAREAGLKVTLGVKAPPKPKPAVEPVAPVAPPPKVERPGQVLVR